ncbi:hypothetical protein NUL58_002316 [Listeria monocytogenes]|nr:hypothetical protein [Listeria monocytogenes]
MNFQQRQNLLTSYRLSDQKTGEKDITHIGDHRLNHWIAHGLKVIPFGKETRFDREDIKNFLNQQKI